MMVTTLELGMCGIRAAVATEAALLSEFLLLQQRFCRRQLRLGNLETEASLLVGQGRRLVNESPVAGNRHLMALITPPGRRDGAPGTEHGTAGQQPADKAEGTDHF